MCHAPRSFVVRSSFAALFAVGICAGTAAAQQILETYDSSLTTYLPGATAIQNLQPRADQRGVNLEGSQRQGGALPWALAGNPFENAWRGTQTLGSMRVDIGTYAPTDIDIALPSTGGAWMIGRSYNARQVAGGSATDSNGPQGYNWAQLATPEIVLYDHATDTSDVLYLVYGADRYIEFNRTGTGSTTYKSKNGAAGVFEFKSVGGGADLWEYTDQHGNVTTFFGFDVDAGVAAGQIWRWSPTFDPTNVYAYVGHASNTATAISSGFDGSGRVTTLYDAADRRYTFSYSSSAIGGVKRLEQVKAETKTSGTWASPSGVATVAKVDYSYYGNETYGDAGDLKLVTITNYLTDSGVTQTKKKYYRYWEGSYNASTNPGYPHAIKYVYDFEGYRRADWDEDGALDDGIQGIDDEDPVVGGGADLKEYAAAYFEYDSSHRIRSAWSNGQCGCSGGSDGTFSFDYASVTYTNNAGYDSAVAGRTVIGRPDTSYVTQFFDETGQALSNVITDTAPSGTPTKKYWTSAARDATGAITDVAMPDAIDTSGAFSSPFASGTPTVKTSAGHIKAITRETTGNLVGFALVQKAKPAGSSSSAVFERKTTWTSFTMSVGSQTLVRPLVSAIKEYPDGPTSDTGGNETSYSQTAWSGTVMSEGLTITHPAVTTANNGSNSATTSYRRLRKDGQVDWEAAADGIVTYRAYTNGQLTTVIEDVDTTADSLSPPTSTPTNFTSTGGLRRKTVTAYDAQGRVASVSSSYGSNAAYSVVPTYYSKLGDERAVVLRYADYDAGNGRWYGPVSYQVLNQAGKSVVSGSIACSGGYSTAAQSTHIDETGTDPITAIDTGSSFGALARMHVNLYDEASDHLIESRSYFSIPGSGLGSDGTNYDATTYDYDDSGRQRRVKEPTGTIRRTVYDLRGNVTERWMGTNDNGLPGGEPSGTSNMFKSEVLEYSDSFNAGLNGLLTKRTLRVDSNSGNDRVTDYKYDERGRLILELPSVAPYTVHKVDSLGRRVATGLYGSSSGLTASTDPTASSSSNRMALSETYYDELGRVWKSVRWKIDDADGSKDDSLEDLHWFDSVGREIKHDGSELTRTRHDRLGRVTDRYVLAKVNDTTYADMFNSGAFYLDSDIVLEENQTRYDATNGTVILSVRIDRLHSDYGTNGSGEAGGTHQDGKLDSNADNDALTLTAANVVGRPQISAFYYDTLEREIERVDYGTYGGSNFTRPGSVDARSDTALRTSTAYNDDGTVQTVTDPRALVTKYEYDGLGRRTAEIKNYDVGVASGAPSGTDDNVTIRYEYTDGLRTKYIADMPSGQTDQTTTYIYGTVSGTPSASTIATGHLLRAVLYPDTTNTGDDHLDINSDSSDVVSHAYNAQGQEVYKKDQAGNVYEMEFDLAGRTTAKKVTTLASGFDGAVRRIDTAYDSLGRTSTVTQLDAASSGSIVDQVKYTYDDWGNVENFEQDRNSAVGAGGSVDDYEVSYTYAKQTTGRNTLRRTAMVLPSGKTISYTYLTRNGIYDNPASRVTEVKDGSVALALYDYNGVGQVVGTDYTEADVISKQYTPGSPGTYPDLDRFNRVVRSRWTKDLVSPVDFYRVDLTYDRDSNITSADDLVHSGFDVKYTMDDVNRLTRAEEGTLGGGTISSRTRDQQWTLSQTGNWNRDKVDLNGDGDFVDTDEVDDTRTHNVVNELTARDTDSNSSNNYTLTFDGAGNQTDDGKDYKYEYDAFYRLRKVKQTGNSALVAEYRYNGLGYKIAVHEDTDTDADVDSNDKWFYDAFDERWRQVARFRESDANPKEEFVAHQAGAGGRGGSSYIDRVVCRYKDANTAWTSASDGVLEEKLYYGQNQHADVVAIVASDGTQREGDRYSAYGIPFGLPSGDADSDGDCDSADVAQIQAWIGTTTYDVRGDTDLDGDVDIGDENYATSVLAGAVVGRTHLSSAMTGNRRGVTGMQLVESASCAYSSRYRWYVGLSGRWISRDPLGYIDSGSLYSYTRGSPINARDPFGLATDLQTTCRSSISFTPVGTTALGADYQLTPDIVFNESRPGDCDVGLPCSFSVRVHLKIEIRRPDDSQYPEFRGCNAQDDPDCCYLWHGDANCGDGGPASAWPTWTGLPPQNPSTGSSETGTLVTDTIPCGDPAKSRLITASGPSIVVGVWIDLKCDGCPAGSAGGGVATGGPWGGSSGSAGPSTGGPSGGGVASTPTRAHPGVPTGDPRPRSEFGDGSLAGFFRRRAPIN